VVVVAEVLVEVVDDRGVAPPRDRNQEVVEEPEHGDGSCRTDDGPDEPDELLAAEDHGAAEEVGADRNEIVLEREADRRPVGRSAEPVLRQDRVHADECREREGENVGGVNPKGKPAGAEDLERRPARARRRAGSPSTPERRSESRRERPRRRALP